MDRREREDFIVLLPELDDPFIALSDLALDQDFFLRNESIVIFAPGLHQVLKAR
jgi:hypothetical protein